MGNYTYSLLLLFSYIKVLFLPIVNFLILKPNPHEAYVIKLSKIPFPCGERFF